MTLQEILVAIALAAFILLVIFGARGLMTFDQMLSIIVATCLLYAAWDYLLRWHK